MVKVVIVGMGWLIEASRVAFDATCCAKSPVLHSNVDIIPWSEISGRKKDSSKFSFKSGMTGEEWFLASTTSCLLELFAYMLFFYFSYIFSCCKES